MTNATDLEIDLGPKLGRVSAILERPPDAWLLYVLAHGAGAGMRHRFLESLAALLASRGVASFRYQFPYMERGRGGPDPPAVLEGTVQAAVRRAAEAAPELPIIAGGKSLGGRMTSRAAAAGPLPAVRGLAFLGFPLHAPGRPGTDRAEHLDVVDLPMLFLQGTRDSFAELDLLRPLCRDLAPRATLHLIEGGDHSFGVPKRSGRTAGEVLDELAGTLVQWARPIVEDRR
ncbi:MAG TPA: alpha/beta family hydrolase [Gemmatimonadales bacterium]|nr:alpha/beta family hydrolase [Gemmatimonadales bacterium]